MTGITSFSFDWDSDKARENLREHGVSFPEAASVFYDPLAAAVEDQEHGFGERRFVTLGCSDIGRLLVVVHTGEELESNVIHVRIISARKVTQRERRHYEEIR